MPNLHIGQDCCGCTACASVCGKNAITMVPDSIGFKYPKVDLDKCVECGMCERVCSFKSDYSTPDNFENPFPYGVRLKDINEVMKSRSGGAFVAFTDWIIDKGGVIYGAGFNDHFIVAHKRAVTSEERDEFRGSKYVQSELDGIFPMVKADLKTGKWVLFSGTGCQVAGLKAYIPKSLQEKLVTVDIVCHGVPSQKMWQDYLSYIEKKEKGEIVGVNFRNKKDYGWNTHRETFAIQDSETGKMKVKTYDYTFYHNMMQRPSCGICHFCNLRRNGDLTLADFWGWEKTGDTMNKDNKGLSLILCSTPKGKKIFEEVYEQINFFEPKLEDCIQNHLKAPTKAKDTDSQFQKDYENRGFEYIVKKYVKDGNIFKIKKLLIGVKRRLVNLLRE